jgi:hypothetical protein
MTPPDPTQRFSNRVENPSRKMALPQITQP